MEIIHIQHPHQLYKLRPASSVAFGNFDGLHLGHQQVIQQAVKIAKDEQLQAGVMTFYPHPKEVLGKVQNATYLTPLPDKLKQIEELGVDFTMIIKFTPAFASLTPQEFIERYIVGLHIKQVITGFDFCFGHRGQGTTTHLQQWSADHQDFHVHVLSLIDKENQKVSSSRIRQLVNKGEMEEIFPLLHHYYQIKGRVIHGDKRGRTIGFPTANVSLKESYVLPKQGVYAVLINWKEQIYPGVLNLGLKPTFHSNLPSPTLEVHLFDFDQDLYDEEITIQFVSFIREEQRFDSIDLLKYQIEQDIKDAKKKLGLII